MANVVGVFYVLLCGTIFAVFYGAICLFLEIRNDAKRRKVREMSYCCFHQIPLEIPLKKKFQNFIFHSQANFCSLNILVWVFFYTENHFFFTLFYSWNIPYKTDKWEDFHTYLFSSLIFVH